MTASTRNVSALAADERNRDAVATIRLVGQVAAWNDLRNYGFVLADARRYFVHQSVVGRPLTVGELVEFTPTMGRRGPRAAGVRRLVGECLKCGLLLTSPTCECGWSVGTT
jgi:cold shock CspA family protein